MLSRENYFDVLTFDKKYDYNKGLFKPLLNLTQFKIGI